MPRVPPGMAGSDFLLGSCAETADAPQEATAAPQDPPEGGPGNPRPAAESQAEGQPRNGPDGDPDAAMSPQGQGQVVGHLLVRGGGAGGVIGGQQGQGGPGARDPTQDQAGDPGRDRRS